MSQRRILSYGALNTAQNHNSRFKGVLKPGRYSGFFPKLVLGGVSFFAGDGEANIVVTLEGVVIEEMSETSPIMLGAAPVSNNRWDLVYLSYTYSSADIDAVYGVKAGVSGTSPDKPVVDDPLHDIPLCYVWREPAPATVTQSSLIPVNSSQHTPGDELVMLKPSIDYTNKKRIWVSPGNFPNSEGTALVEFEGGYSAELDTSSYSNGFTYVLFGVGDDKEIEVVDTSTTSPTSFEFSGTDYILLCVATVEKDPSSAEISTLLDVRFWFSRSSTITTELNSYIASFSDSVFQYMTVDTFSDDSIIDLTSLASEYDINVSSGFTKLEITPNVAYGTLSQNFTINTVDLIDRLPASDQHAVDYWMGMADSDADEVYFSFSSTGASFGSETPSNVKASGGGASNFFIQLRIDQSEFDTGVEYQSISIYSYALLTKLREEVLNVNTLNTYQLNGLLDLKVNLIDNPFLYWDNSPSSLASSTEEVSANTNILGPDGWQVVASTLEGVEATKTQNGSLKITKADSDISHTLELEYRNPILGQVSEKYLSFGVDYTDCGAVGGLSVGIRAYKLSAGVLVVDTEWTALALPSNSQVIVRSDQIGGDVVCVGFYIKFTGALSSGCILSSPSAVFGKVYSLDSVPSYNVDRVRSLYQAGRSILTYSAQVSDQISTLTPIVEKNTNLGSLVTRVLEEDGSQLNRSINIQGLSITAEGSSLIASGVASKTGAGRLDLEWESFIKYEV